MCCEPADVAADHLLEGLAAAFGLPSPITPARICEAVWAEAPGAVCLVFDDVHEVPRGSASADVLQQLVDDLPANGHVVLASRDPVPVTTARLATTAELTRIREPDLVFDDDELQAFAEARQIDVAVLGGSGGWPALAELAASVGEDLMAEYLWEEVLADIGPSARPSSPGSPSWAAATTDLRPRSPANRSPSRTSWPRATRAVDRGWLRGAPPVVGATTVAVAHRKRGRRDVPGRR